MGWISGLISILPDLAHKLARVKKFLRFYYIPQERYIAEKEVQIDANWPVNGSISFEKAELRYRDTTALVLKQLSFSVAPG